MFILYEGIRFMGKKFVWLVEGYEHILFVVNSEVVEPLFSRFEPIKELPKV